MSKTRRSLLVYPLQRFFLQQFSSRSSVISRSASAMSDSICCRTLFGMGGHIVHQHWALQYQRLRRIAEKSGNRRRRTWLSPVP
jgi:hypothetical protein